jgi:recombinational DNA repair ATPase RecF
MTYEQFHWLLNGIFTIEPQHAQRFYDETATHISARFAAVWQPYATQMGQQMGETLAAKVKDIQRHAEEISKREAAMEQREAEFLKHLKTLEESMIQLAVDRLLGKAVGKG